MDYLKCKDKKFVECMTDWCSEKVMLDNISDGANNSVIVLCNSCTTTAHQCKVCHNLTHEIYCKYCKEIREKIFKQKWDDDIFFPDLEIIIKYMVRYENCSLYERDLDVDYSYGEETYHCPVLRCFECVGNKITYDVLMNYYIPDDTDGQYYLKEAKTVERKK